MLDVRVCRFYGGTLSLAVDYDDATSLRERLERLAEGSWRLEPGRVDRIDLTFDEAAELPLRAVSSRPAVQDDRTHRPGAA